MIPRTRPLTVTGTMPVTLATAKQNMRVDCNDEDSLIEAFIRAAVDDAASRCGIAIVRGTYRLTADWFPDIVELLGPSPAVTAVKYLDESGVLQTLSPSAYVVDDVGNRIASVDEWPTVKDTLNAVQVEFSAGYQDGQVPAALIQWILLAVGDLYENRSRSAEKPVIAQGFADSLLEPFKVWA